MIKNNAIANFLGRIWPSLLGIILVPVYLHTLGVDAYGLIGFFLSLQGLIQILDMGLATTANREVAKRVNSLPAQDDTRDLVRTLEIIYWAMASLIALAIIISADWLATQWLPSQKIPADTIRWAAIIFGITLALRWPVALYTGVLRGLERQVLQNTVSAAIVTLKNGGAALVIVLISPTILAFLLWQMALALLEVVAMGFIAWRAMPAQDRTKSSFRVVLLGQVWKFSATVGMTSLLASIVKQFDRVMISRLLTLEWLGYYTAAYTVYESLALLVGPVVDAAFPRFTSLLAQDDLEGLARTYHKTAQFISFTVSPAASFLIFFSYDVLYLWTRSADLAEHAALTLSVLAIAYLFNAMMHIPIALQYAAGITRIAFGVNVFALIFFAPLIYILIGQYGIAGAGISWAIFNFLYFLITPHIMHRYLLREHKMKWLFVDTLPFMSLSVLVFGGVFFVSQQYSQWYLTLASIITAGLLYLTLCLVFYPSIRSLLKEVLEKTQLLRFAKSQL